MGFGNTKSTSQATDNRIALDGGGSVLQGGSGIFNSGKGRVDWTTLAIIGGVVIVLAIIFWKKL